MNHRVWRVGAGLLLLAGCAEPQIRSQSADDGERDKFNVKTIGDVTAFANMEPIRVGGVGLVMGLEGTGGSPQQSEYSRMLEDDLKKKGIEHPKEILASRDNSLVLVSAFVPPGAHKGDPIDIEVALPPQSKTTSLRGGVLQNCVLINFDFAKNVLPGSSGPDFALQGHPLVSAQGKLQVGLGAGDEAGRLKRGRIWGGGQCHLDRPLFLILNHDQQRAPLAAAIADRINDAFQGAYGGPGARPLAVAQTKELILLNIPPQYRHNLPRYLRVVRLIPLQSTVGKSSEARAAAGGKPAASLGSAGLYRRRLEQELLEPERTVTAALRLEALGIDSIPGLKRGLASDSVLVRFCAAEALAYLGSSACGEELARLVETKPALEAYCLTALASLDEGICHVKLRELLACTRDEARYGAFRALRVLDEDEPAVQGELLNESFWLHQVAPNASPLIHLTTGGRAEIVLFGGEPALAPRFSFQAGEFALTAAVGDDHCTVSCISARHGARRRQCSLKVADVLRTLAYLGADYADVVELLRQAGDCRCLTCRVAVDALPQDTSVYALAKAGKLHTDPHRPGADELDLRDDKEIEKASAEFLYTPTLFQKAPGQQMSVPPSQDAGPAARAPRGG